MKQHLQILIDRWKKIVNATHQTASVLPKESFEKARMLSIAEVMQAMIEEVEEILNWKE